MLEVYLLKYLRVILVVIKLIFYPQAFGLVRNNAIRSENNELYKILLALVFQVRRSQETMVLIREGDETHLLESEIFLSTLCIG